MVSPNHGQIDHSGFYPGNRPLASRKTLAERRNWRTIFAASCLVSVLAFTATLGMLYSDCPGTGNGASMSSQAMDAVNYLVYNYNNGTDDTGLIYESSDTNGWMNHTYWVYSDNFLASLVLEAYNPQMAENIRENMTTYLASYDMTDPSKHVNFYMALTEPFMWGWRASPKNGTNITPGGELSYWIRTDVHDQGLFDDAAEYANIMFLQAINESKWGDPVKANASYDLGVLLWDGKGFSDKGSNYTHDNYQTFKVALYIYASKLLGRVDSVNYTQALHVLPLMQKHGGEVPETDGGFSTWYSWPDSSPDPIAEGSTNVETTSLAILALDLPSPEISEFGLALVPVTMMLATVVVICGKRKRI
jgi:hypothetical protein